MDHPLLLAVIGALLLTTVAQLWWHARSKRRWVEIRAADADHHSALTSALHDEHAEAFSTLQARHVTTIASQSHTHWSELRRQERKHEGRVTEMTASLANSEAVRDRAVLLAASGMKWELASRAALVAACDAAQLDAVIATNIVFVPADSADRPFCAQVDHLVITQNAALLVDSKRWRGLVFDGIRPSVRAAPLSALFDESTLTGSFAIQLSTRDKDATRIDARFELGEDSPAHKARIQASRLHRFLGAHSAAPPFIETCVFYSHPDATVVSGGTDRSGRSVTHIATAGNIGGVLQRVHGPRDEGAGAVPLAQTTSVLRSLGADLVGTGRFADEYRSPVPLHHRNSVDRHRDPADASPPREPVRARGSGQN